MKLAIVNLTGGGLSGGYRKYLQALIPLFEKNESLHHLTVFVPPGSEALLKIDSPNILSWPLTDRRNRYPWLKRKIRELSPDIIFIPTAALLPFGEIPITIMVRNMEPLTIPFERNPFREKFKNVVRAYMARKACNNATRIIAVSHHVKDFLVNQWNVKPSKIGTVFHGADLLPVSNVQSTPPEVERWQNKRFFFTAGSIRPARGLEDIFYAIAGLRTNDYDRLVIAGEVNPGMAQYKKELERLTSNLGIASRIVWADSLSKEAMSWCYQKSIVFLMTSRAEACPNIALEAMAHGCVCISTETQPMPEFFGDAAVYYPAKNGKTLSESIQAVLNWDDNKRSEMSAKARKRAGDFSWDSCAEKTIEELKKALK